MFRSPSPWSTVVMLAAAIAPAPAQAPTHAMSLPAIVDASATEPGGFVLSIPGLGNDFVTFGDGQFVVRPNGTARLSALVVRAAALDRSFFVQLEFSGRVAPGDAGYPPVGSPVLTLVPAAYVPAGAVDPATFTFYTQVAGTLTGVRAYEGARLTATHLGNAQIGLGASNKNVLPGLALDLNLTVVQQPVYGTISGGTAELRATLEPDSVTCATHVDAEPAWSGGTARSCLQIPGVAADYLFVPVGEFTEASDGTATLQGIVRRQSDYADEWSLTLSLAGRVDPGSAGHPPVGSPTLQLLPAAYASQGGPVDPSSWRYYTQVTGSLTGAGINAGGTIPLTASSALQVGLGADNGNLFFGLAGQFAAGTIVQPTSRVVSVTGTLELRANVAESCILPVMQVLTGQAQSIPSVTEQEVLYTGVELGWTEAAAIGFDHLGTDQRLWYEGHVRVVDHTTVAVSVPQGRVPGTYPMYFFNKASISNPLSLTYVAPTIPTLRTEDDRLTGETQHWVVHQGNLTSWAYSFLGLSESNLPSVAPGLVDLGIGNQFANLIIYGGAFHDPATGVAVVTLTVPDTILGIRFYSQAATLDGANPNLFPLVSSNVWFTDY